MSYYPIYLNLAGKTGLVVGLGEVGRRKLSGLLKSDIEHILALDPHLDLTRRPGSDLLDKRVKFEKRICTENDIKESFIVFAATSRPAENSRIIELCRKHKTLCNSAMQQAPGDFILPAKAEYGELCAAISTSGQSPALAKIWKGELQAWLASKWRQAWLLGKLRPIILSLQQEQDKNRQIFYEIINSQALSLLEEGKIDLCGQWLKSYFPERLHSHIDTLLVEYSHAFSRIDHI